MGAQDVEVAPAMDEPVDQQVGGESPQEQAVAPAEDSADAAFEMGFDAARHGAEPEPEPEPPKLIAGYTEDELRERLAKADEVDRLREQQSKLFGKMGAFQQSLEAVKSARPQQANIALTRLAQEYPELAQTLADDLRESLVGGSAADAQAVEKIVSEKLEGVGKTYETKLLSVMHPDWRSIPSMPEFAQWKGTLSPDELRVVDDSWDALSVGEALSKFKSWKAQTIQAKQQRQSRLEAAVTPRGTRQPTPSLTEQDAFEAGFKSVRG